MVNGISYKSQQIILFISIICLCDRLFLWHHYLLVSAYLVWFSFLSHKSLCFNKSLSVKWLSILQIQFENKYSLIRSWCLFSLYNWYIFMKSLNTGFVSKNRPEKIVLVNNLYVKKEKERKGKALRSNWALQA